MSVMSVDLLTVGRIHTYHIDRYCESLAAAFLGPLTGVQLIQASPYTNNLMVTPKEIDTLIKSTARIIAGALGICLHPGITREEYQTYLQ